MIRRSPTRAEDGLFCGIVTAATRTDKVPVVWDRRRRNVMMMMMMMMMMSMMVMMLAMRMTVIITMTWR